MQYLIDTNILLMWLTDDQNLDREIWGYLCDPHNEIYVSSVTALDMVEQKLRKELDCPNNLEGVCVQSGFKLLPLHLSHIAEFERIMRDSPEQLDILLMLLIAQAKTESLTLITANSAISHFNVSYIIHYDQIPQARQQRAL